MKLAWSLAVATLTGCATIDGVECRNSYEVGFRDAIMGLQRQDNLYEPLCTRQGARLDTALYVEGWLNGKQEFDRRTPHIE